ncbi:MAG: alpha/beta hydrolase family protein [Pseudonocardiaceae bacterium]
MTAIDTLARGEAQSNALDKRSEAWGDTPGAPVLARVSFSFSSAGTTGTCLAADEYGSWQLETWSFDGPSPRWRSLPLAQAVTPRDQLVPLNDGRILLCRNRSTSHEISLITCGTTVDERKLHVIESRGLRLLPDPGTRFLAVAVATDERGCSSIWRVSARPPHLVHVGDLSGLLLGGVWLDCAGTLLAVDRTQDDGPAKAVAMDLRDASWTSLLDISPTSNDRLLAYHPGSGLLLASTDAPGDDRLGWGRLDGSEPVRFPDTLHQPAQAAQPLGFGPDGHRALVHFDEGVRSRLAVYTPASDHLAPISIPPGRVRGMVAWTDGRMRFPFSTPTQPTCLATTGTGATASWSLTPDMPIGRHWAEAHIEHLPGEQGPIETIVYGGTSWRTSKHLVVALHGGPMSAWRFEFEPLFQTLAAAGIAVVAPNQRGSSGYGAEHTLAIRSAWGGPDLDDIRCIARALATERRAIGVGRLAVFGVSYGAFLALLATSCEPDLWSHCVALAPFLSGTQLHREASPRVRMLLEQLGGCQDLRDDLGSRDVLRLCRGIRARLLLIHGDQDSVIPVTQSRALRRRLLELGRCEGMEFEYLEIPGGRHALLSAAGGNALHQQIVRFLLAEKPATGLRINVETRKGGETR